MAAKQMRPSVMMMLFVVAIAMVGGGVHAQSIDDVPLAELQQLEQQQQQQQPQQHQHSSSRQRVMGRQGVPVDMQTALAVSGGFGGDDENHQRSFFERFPDATAADAVRVWQHIVEQRERGLADDEIFLDWSVGELVDGAKKKAGEIVDSTKDAANKVADSVSQVAKWGQEVKDSIHKEQNGSHSFQIYGKYCGPGYGVTVGGRKTTSEPPIDALDTCCKIHDECYNLSKNPNEGPQSCCCDAALVACAAKSTCSGDASCPVARGAVETFFKLQRCQCKESGAVKKQFHFTCNTSYCHKADSAAQNVVSDITK